ncbi:hypothetical protein [Nocardiopsis sp. CC223A]|uniref:hypothetical protein n=1 Tax=Nocardiopsis sp. CC223A TaxID=3044051 RepID=UPI00278C89E2|nr:hypothetical protein [Nocardiopsis sp. CC223A]
MYFPPATFEPGPTATVIGFATLLFLFLTPYLVSGLHRARAVLTRPSGLAGLTLALSAVELAAVVAFHTTAVRGLTLRDLAPGDIQLHGPEWRVLVGDVPPLWLVTGAVAVLFATFVVWASRNRSRVPEAPQVQLAQWSDRDMRRYRANLLLGMLSSVAVYYLVLYPLLAVYFGPLTGVLAVAMLAGWQYRASGAATMLAVCLSEGSILGFYVFVAPGGLILPLLWSVGFALLIGRRTAEQRAREIGAPALEVTVLDADGAPVPRREG